MEFAEGGYVNHDARAGDVITVAGHNFVVANTFPECVDIRLGPLGALQRWDYRELQNQKAYYAARLIPCRPPEGERKV